MAKETGKGKTTAREYADDLSAKELQDKIRAKKTKDLSEFKAALDTAMEKYNCEIVAKPIINNDNTLGAMVLIKNKEQK